MQEGHAQCLTWDILRLLTAKFCRPREALILAMSCKRLYAVFDDAARMCLFAEAKHRIEPMVKIDWQKFRPRKHYWYNVCKQPFKQSLLKKHMDLHDSSEKNEWTKICRVCFGIAHAGTGRCPFRKSKCDVCGQQFPYCYMIDLGHFDGLSGFGIKSVAHIWCGQCIKTKARYGIQTMQRWAKQNKSS